MLSELRAVMVTTPSDLVSTMSMLVSLNSSIRLLIVVPPGPMIFPMATKGTENRTSFGTEGASSGRGFAWALSMWTSMWTLPSLACASADLRRLTLRPSHLMSSWKAVMPLASPQTLKSMVPSESSRPRMSVRMTASSSIFLMIASLFSSFPLLRFSGSSRPIATPATGRLSGTPASKRARQPPHTEAMDELPQLSVMRDSTRMV
mmetsp:Transcript_49045/g.153989  ORF Transcript_49045/g.153989 Transcript_49045/m.153989 type:complete len:205 (+) Transcript_49045:410-1024(+)